MKKLEWEKMSDRSERLKVPGGWIIKSWITHSTGCSISQVFISDPTYDWLKAYWPQPEIKY